jgi:hypothetical protein
MLPTILDEDELMNKMTFAIGGMACALSVVAMAGPAFGQAQEGFPLGPTPTRGLPVSPFFEGWYHNPEGTYTLSFGYFNANTDEVVDVPIGPDNMVEPAAYNGMQPTHFPPVSYGGFSGRRERGVFAVTVPADFVDKEVVWTIRSNGKVERVPGRVTSAAYELGLTPMAMGSRPPSVRFEPNGPLGRGPEGVVAVNTLRANVGAPLELSFWAADDQSDRKSDPVPLGVTWLKHQGPGEVEFSGRTGSIPVGGDGLGTTTATFSAPGEYTLRVRVDNHRAPDSSPADQCCWTNGYVRVKITEE